MALDFSPNEENAALVALMRTCEKPDTWTSLTNDCLIEGSAIRVLRHRIDPAHNPLHNDEFLPDDMQGELFDVDEVVPDHNRAEALEMAWRNATAQIAQWRDDGLDFVSVFDRRFPARLRAIVDAPPFLFAKGQLADDDQGVSVVGSRHCSPESAAFARQVAAMLVARGLTVIAGLAEGVDSFAHQEALELGGRTVAFIGTGINHYYPAANKQLQQHIEEQGLVLSQFWPDTPPTKRTFPMRNALMSGYGLATVVVESSEYSGTRIQARQAQHHGRPLILRNTVVEHTQWAKEYVDKPGVYVVHTVEELSRALDAIAMVDNGVDRLLEQIVNEERQRV